MVLHRILIQDGGSVIMDCHFVDAARKSTGIYTTILLGENGVGKSFSLKAITDIFLFLEKAKKQNRKPKYQYNKFEVEYEINDSIYRVKRESGSRLLAYKDECEVDYKSIELPKRILAVSFIVNDKFVFSNNDDNNMYQYLGVRSSTNSTYTSSIIRKMTESVFEALNHRRELEIRQVLNMINFDNTRILYECGPQGNSRTELIDLIENQKTYEMSKYLFRDLKFIKKGKPISFNSCSSGEKHLLFAFIGILSKIAEDCIVLIDEPEISLHPSWQITYISRLMEIYRSYKDLHFILASHSHYFVSDVPNNNSSIVVFRNSGNSFVSELLPYNPSAWSAENIIYNVFGLRTSRNFYFEKDIQKLIDEMGKQQGQDRDAMLELIAKLKKYILSDDDPLDEFIKKAEKMISV